MKFLNIVICLMTLFISTSCEEQTDVLSLNVNIKGTIKQYSQFGEEQFDYENTIVTLTDSYNDYSFDVSNDGTFMVDGIKTGTYNLIIYSKDYVPIKQEGMQLLGGKTPSYLNYSLTQPSTGIPNLLSTMYENYRITISGVLTNTMLPENMKNGYYQLFAVAISKKDDVSAENYDELGYQMAYVDSHGLFELPIYYGSSETLYCITYCAPNKGGYTASGLSNPSNIIMIKK